MKQILQIRRHNAAKTFLFHIATARAMGYVSTVLYCIMCYMIARFMRCQFRDAECKREMKRENECAVQRKSMFSLNQYISTFKKFTRSMLNDRAMNL